MKYYKETKKINIKGTIIAAIVAAKSLFLLFFLPIISSSSHVPSIMLGLQIYNSKRDLVRLESEIVKHK